MIPRQIFRSNNINQQGSTYVKVPLFYTPDVAGLQFGGFLCDKYLCSQPNAANVAGDAWYSVAHSGVAGSVIPKSKKGVPVWDYITFPQAMIACANRGKGWHLMTDYEYASLAHLAKKLGTIPHGGNSGAVPPSASEDATEIATLDAHYYNESSMFGRALPGTGPVTWAHNHLRNGIYDLQGTVYQWTMGLFLAVEGTDGHPDILANLDATYAGSPYGRGTISGSGGATPTLTVDGSGVNWLKNWTADAFNNMKVYIAEANTGQGVFYTIADTTATSLILAASSAPGDGTATFVIVRHVATNITAGCTSGKKVLTLRDTDADLKGFAIPATTSDTGDAAYSGDVYYFSKTALRAALRGGFFNYSARAGVFYLDLSAAPSRAYYYIGFRACKAL